MTISTSATMSRSGQKREWRSVSGVTPLKTEYSYIGASLYCPHKLVRFRLHLRFFRRRLPLCPASSAAVLSFSETQAIVPAPWYRSGHVCSATQGFGECFGRGALRSKTAEDGELGVVYNKLRTFLAVVLFKLRKGLYNQHYLQAAGTGG